MYACTAACKLQSLTYCTEKSGCQKDCTKDKEACDESACNKHTLMLSIKLMLPYPHLSGDIVWMRVTSAAELPILSGLLSAEPQSLSGTWPRGLLLDAFC